MSKTILVSGGAGFVGRHLLYALYKEAAGHDIWVIDDMSTGKPPDQWELHRGELVADLGWAKQYRLPEFSEKPFHLIEANFAGVLGAELGVFPKGNTPELPRFDEVYHLASIVGGRAVIEGKPLLVGMDLAIDSLFFLWAATTNKADRILYASSSAAYPINQQTFDAYQYLTEDMIDFEKGLLAPDLTYGWSKLTGEYLSQIAVQKHQLKVGIVRPFSGYGEDQDPSYPTPAIALRVAARQNPIRVWGSGLQGRDFIHISDCVDALILTCRKVSDATALNLGTGILTPFLDLAKLMVRLEGYDAPVMGTDNRPVGVAHRVSGSKKAEEVLNWKPSISIEEGMGRVVKHAHWRLANGYQPNL